MQPYCSPPTKARISTEGQAAARGSVKALWLHMFQGYTSPAGFPLIPKAQCQTKAWGEKIPVTRRHTVQNQNCWRTHKLVDPPWRAICNYLSIPQIFQVSIDAATSINTTKCMDPHTQPSHFLESSYRHTPNTGNVTHIQDVPQLASTRLETQHMRQAEQASVCPQNTVWRRRRQDGNTVPLNPTIMKYGKPKLRVIRQNKLA